MLDKENPEYNNVPDHIKQAMIDYYLYNQPVGHFLTAVLKNDLKGALGRADAHNRRNLFSIVKFAYNELPATCWGDEETVDNWEGAPENIVENYRKKLE